MESTERWIASLAELRAFGVHFSIDDFGTGCSSLSYLRRLPVGVVKIDRSFVRDIGEGGGVIVQTVVDMARNLGLHAAAEGVETQAQADALTRMGCVFGGGCRFSPPLPHDAATRALAGTPHG